MITITLVGAPKEKLINCLVVETPLYKLSIIPVARGADRYWYGFFRKAPLLTRLYRKFQEALIVVWFAQLLVEK